ncbi:MULTISPECIES: hypothetical protein [Dyella]|uniref:Uncharacterized protein n=2 Tax=Dyella TaxID=231454 RepID=A0A4R0Z068_9GAMM|nr:MULTISPECIES: hypothetical protein [Dyella]TBR39399.1 hypothetical protein EYV96_04050 [Dyella terrae]TCI13014.1 hypothetical protein EZM97_06815 [Dyella soli]
MSALPKSPLTISRPRLSARSAAKFVRLPAVEQMRLLHDQKYPKQTPQVFKQPYYAPPLNGIRDFLDRGLPGLVDARAKIQSLSIKSRRDHCNRVLTQFVESGHAHRGLKPTTMLRCYASMSDLELRLSPDLCAMDGKLQRVIYFNANASEQDPEAAKMTLEIAHWVLEQNGENVAPRQLEFIDLFSGKVFSINRRRQKTIKLLEENARLIESLWSAIEP